MGTRRTLESAGVRLAVREAGDPAAPTVVLVHGYPDTGAVWDEVVERLRERYHVVTYDVRGAGASGAPSGSAGYTLAQLVDDLAAVLETVSPRRPVHLVGHDWGSVQCWEAVTGELLAGRIASFTSISGPCLDHVGHWIRSRLRPFGLGQLARQALRSWYIGFFQLPLLPEVMWRSGVAGWLLERLEDVPPRPGHPAPTLAEDAARGLALYRVNMLRRLREPRERRTDIGVQVVIPTRDRYVSPALFDDLGRRVPRLWRRQARAGHWVQRSHPDLLARWITELVTHVEGAPAARPLRRARVGVPRGPFEDRLVVVTGAGSGIGRATALAFAETGAEVAAADIDGEAAARTAELAGLLGPPARGYQVDVADGTAMEKFAEVVEQEHGVPDIVVNNAGIGLAGPFLETSPEDWERIIDVNLWGVIHSSRLFGSRMVAHGEGGHLVTVASAAAYQPSRLLPAYSTTKAAVLMLTQCLRAELAGCGIGVSAICPGFVDTPITRSVRFAGVPEAEQERRRRRAARLYRRRGFPPDRVAREILRAVRENAPVVPVTVEARTALALSRLSPAALRALARIEMDPTRSPAEGR